MNAKNRGLRTLWIGILLAGSSIYCQKPQKDQRFLDEAVTFLETHQARILKEGTPLNEPQLAMARKLGVSHPERVRYMIVDRIPKPKSAWLREELVQFGLDLDRAAGLTLGDAIYITHSGNNATVMVHELTHVAQYAQYGGIRGFLIEYFQQLEKYGYREAPIEANAFKNGALYGEALEKQSAH